MTVEKRFAKGYIFSDRPHPEARPDQIFLENVPPDGFEADGRPRFLWFSWETARIGKPITTSDDRKDNLYPVFVNRQEVIEAGGIIVPEIRLPAEVWDRIHTLEPEDQ